MKTFLRKALIIVTVGVALFGFATCIARITAIDYVPGTLVLTTGKTVQCHALLIESSWGTRLSSSAIPPRATATPTERATCRPPWCRTREARESEDRMVR